MSSIIKAFSNGYNRMVEKSWDHIYILIDIHGTVFKPSYHNKETYDFYKFAKETLQELSKYDFFKLIMWTSSNKDTINDFIRVFNENDIHFDYVNENPEIHALSSDPKSSDFSDKFYFNVGIDDKFGFDPEEDWIDLYDFITRNFH